MKFFKKVPKEEKQIKEKNKGVLSYSKIDGKVCNIVPEDSYRDITLNTLEQIATTISKTAGPGGGNIMIEKDGAPSFMTKDGYTVLNHMVFRGCIATAIHKTMQQTSSDIVTRVGDGSSAIMMAAYHLYKVLVSREEYTKIFRPKQIIDTLADLSNSLCQEIMIYQNDISEDLSELQDIATISLNNDSELGRLVYEVYSKVGRTGYVNVELGNTDKTFYEVAKGFEIDYGFIDNLFVNVAETEECVLNDPNIIMFDTSLHDTRFISVLQNIIMYHVQIDKPLTIICPGYGKIITRFFRELYATFLKAGRLPQLNIITIPTAVERDYQKFEDLSIKIGATPIRTSDDEDLNIDFTDFEKYEKYLGGADKIISNKKSTTIFGGKGNAEIIDARIKSLQNELDKETAKLAGDVTSVETYFLGKRIAVLTDNLATIIVGGVTEQERLATKALMDDAVSACKCALRSGYTIGGNDAILRSCSSMYNVMVYHGEIGLKLLLLEDFYNAMLEVSNTIRRNANYSDLEYGINSYDSMKPHKTENMVDDSIKVINPVQTEIEIVKNIISIISLLITCKGFITKDCESVFNLE